MIGMPLPGMLLLLGLFAEPAAAEPGDLSALLERARKVQEADVQAWARYRFQRRALRERLGSSGKVLEAEDLLFLVAPRKDGFDERLLKVDGRSPTPGEVSRRRRQALFTKHYVTLIRGKGASGKEGGYSLGDLLKMSSYRYAGLETVEGAVCHRLDFAPASRVRGGVAGRLAGAMAGSLWITRDGLHILRARAATVRRVSLFFPVARVSKLRIELESRRVAADVWLPRRINVLSEAKIFGIKTRRRNLYQYSDFAPARQERRRGR